jgi:hypothetical protein
VLSKRALVAKRSIVEAVALAAVVAAVGAGCGGRASRESGRVQPSTRLRHVRLPGLPIGPRTTRFADASLEYVSPAQLVSRATVVFLGTAVGKGGSEVVAPETEATGPAVSVHRIRFRADAVFRGPRVDAFDVSVVDAVDLDPFEAGRQYVVFAEPRTFGTEQTSRLAPVGYFQGSFLRGADPARPDVAVNERGDSVSVSNPLGTIAVGGHR